MLKLRSFRKNAPAVVVCVAGAFSLYIWPSGWFRRFVFFVCCLSVFLFGCVQDESGGTDGYDGSVFDADAVFVAQNFILKEGACEAGSIAKGVDQLALLVALYVDDAVAAVHTHIARFNRGVDDGADTPAADDIVSFLQGENLLEAEHVFNDGDVAEFFLVGFGFLFEVFFFAEGFHFTFAQADAELLAAVLADKYQ